MKWALRILQAQGSKAQLYGPYDTSEEARADLARIRPVFYGVVAPWKETDPPSTNWR